MINDIKSDNYKSENYLFLSFFVTFAGKLCRYEHKVLFITASLINVIRL